MYAQLDLSGEQVQWALAVRQRTEEEMTKRLLEVSLLGKDLNTAVKWREITLRGLVRMKDKY